MNKEALRKQYKAKRKELKNTKLLSDQIIALLLNHFDLEGKCISIFLPIERFKEIDTTILLETLGSKAKFSISVSNMKDNSLHHLIYENEEQIEVNSWGIPEPKYGKSITEKEFDIILVPLLVFDSKGSRIGYGKGFYDRFLSKCSPKSLKIGLSYFEAIEELIETNENDFTLDYCVTTTQVYDFN